MLHEETRAKKLAERVLGLSESEVEGPLLEAEIKAFLSYLTEDLETHFHHEESDLFPHLVERDLALEVTQALEQHKELRRMRRELRELCQAPALDRVALGAALRRIAKTLLQHIAYEADFLYVDLEHDEARSFREGVDADRYLLHRAKTVPPPSKV